MQEAQRVLYDVSRAGVDLRAVTQKLLTDGLAAFEADFQKLLTRVAQGLASAPVAGA